MKASPDSWAAPPPGHPVLGGSQVHVWRFALSRASAAIASLARTLSADERARAAAFRQAADRGRFLLGRGRLRALLGRYLGREAAELVFTSNPFGKPALVAGPGEAGIEFNVAHSGDWVLIALSRDRAVGVDVEEVRPAADLEAVARMIFSAREFCRFNALPPGARPGAFFHAWARKEAILKALGKGLSLPPDRVEVSRDPGGPTRLRLEDADWFQQDLEVGPGYAAAVAVAGGDAEVCCWDGDR